MLLLLLSNRVVIFKILVFSLGFLIVTEIFMIMEVDFVTSEILEEELPLDLDENIHDIYNFEGERCGICMDIVIDRGVLDCCHHWFCFGCIDNWATITNLCPLCQNEFQSITCVPVYDTIGSNKVDEDSLSRDDDWSIEGKNNTLSFPSYYIDENAVICLDGDGCKIRSGSANIEEESNLDTSIACDSCDIWYHAFCVGFDAEGTSEDTWLCPRCTVGDVPQKSDVALLQKPNNQCYSENSHSSSFSVAEAAFSGKMTVSIADAGETAVVVSMDLMDDAVKPDGNRLKVERQSSEKTDVQATMEARELELSLSCDASFSHLSTSLVLAQLKTICDDGTVNEPIIGDDVKNPLTKVFNDSLVRNKMSEKESSEGLHLGLSLGCSSSGYIKTNETEDQGTVEVQQQSVSEESLLRRDEKILPVANEETMKTIGVKRKHATFSDDADKTADDNEDNANNEAEALAKKNRVSRKLQITPKDQDSAFLPEDSQKCPTKIAVFKDVKLKRSLEKQDVTSDIMSVVKGVGRRTLKGLTHQNPPDKSSKERENAAGLRVKKIMRRAVEDKESSVVVQKLRKEIREAVRNRSSAEIGENLFDPKLLAAFRTAVAGSTAEPVKKLPPSSMKAKKSLLQKGKVRENLTKKIYGDSNGRRKRAWDRDCDVEFWKYRCMRVTKPEKIATLKSVLTLLRKNPEGSEMDQGYECQETNSILSRLYLADTSEISMDKVRKPSLDDHTLKSAEANKVSAKLVVPSLHDKGFKNKVPSTNCQPASSKAQPGGGSKVNSQKERGAQSDDKRMDKKKWALEVLARKKAVSGKTAADEKQEDSAMLKGNYPLLAQLPIDMRPVLASGRHNKIPISVRQTQLHRLTENFLRKVNLPEIRKTAETELAVADAINIEKEIADKSNSKIVYLNLCSQEIMRQSDDRKSNQVTVSNSSPSAVTVDGSEQAVDELPTDPAILNALRNAGLLSDSPPSSPHHKMEVSNEVDDSSMHIKEEGPDNIFEMDSHPDVDIYGDFEYNLEDEDYIGATTLTAPKLVEEAESRMKVVFSTHKSEMLNNFQDHEGCLTLGNNEEPKDSAASSKIHAEADIISTTVEGGTNRSCADSESLPGEEGEEPSLAECDELYGPDKEPLLNKFPEEASRNLYELADPEASTKHKGSAENENNSSRQDNTTSAGHTYDGETSCDHSQTAESCPKKDSSKINTNKQGDIITNSVSKKVEAYIKEHIRPLCKSGIIDAEQYRWAVAKTTDKVMKYHLNAKNANFLIKEGEKVKKLSEQYVEAAQQKGKGVPYD
ncbi:PHD domain-containing protein/zf-C3HC4 domain-containing protein [Salix suchowensis]|nr:PHD domain-containing protein/zf-C3HC4 domain-containing protein [Salix suchowensis]